MTRYELNKLRGLRNRLSPGVRASLDRALTKVIETGDDGHLPLVWAVYLMISGRRYATAREVEANIALFGVYASGSAVTAAIRRLRLPEYGGHNVDCQIVRGEHGPVYFYKVVGR